MKTRNRLSRPTQAGFSLAVVLWAAVLLGLAAAAVMGTARTDVRLQTIHQDLIAAELTADAALWTAAERLNRLGPQRWSANGGVYALSLNGHRARVRFTEEYGRIDANAASLDLLSALFMAAGEDPSAATDAALAIIEYRRDHGGDPANPAFKTPESLARTLGVPPALIARVSDALTVFTGRARPSFGVNSPILRAALGRPPLEPFEERQPIPGFTLVDPGGRPASGFSGLVRVQAEALTASGAHFAREAVILLPLSGAPDFQTRMWRRGERRLFSETE